MPEMQQPSFYRSQLDVQLWWMTAILIALNVGLYLWQITSGVDSANPSMIDAIAWGADYTPLTFLEEPQRLFTSIFFHFGFIHLALNMWGLYIFGSIAEQLFGRFYYLNLYVICGLSGSLLSSWFSIQDSLMLMQHPAANYLPVVHAGASGAVMGIGGALTLLSFFPPLPHQRFVLLKRTLLMVLALNLAIGFMMPNIDNAAHWGGMIMGVLMAAVWILFQHQQYPTAAKICGCILGWSCIVVSYFYCQHLVLTVTPLWQQILQQLHLMN
ncbi:MAG: rhomboid family intramembrane serine protease [Acinetobacter sp.]